MPLCGPLSRLARLEVTTMKITEVIKYLFVIYPTHQTDFLAGRIHWWLGMQKWLIFCCCCGPTEVVHGGYYGITALSIPKLVSGKTEDLVFGIIIVSVFIPIIVGKLLAFGICALRREYDDEK